MEEMYACLLGKWVNLTAEEMTIEGLPALDWWHENSQDALAAGYIEIYHRRRKYQIHPSFIQTYEKSNW